MLDEYVVGQHTRQSPEADIPIILQDKIDYRLGGAANVAANLKALEMKPHLISIIGNDFSGQKIRELCKSENISNQFFEIIKRPTTTKKRVVDRDFKQFLRIDSESIRPISSESETALINYVIEYLNIHKVTGLILQDYNKGLMTIALIKAVQDICTYKNVPLFVDPKRDNFEQLASCTVFKPNLKELSQFSHLKIKPLENAIKEIIIAKQLDKNTLCIVTLAEHGVFYYDKKNNTSGIISGKKLENPDVSGAGDSVLACIVKAYNSSLNVVQIAKIANGMGRLICQKTGVSTVSIRDYELILSENKP